MSRPSIDKRTTLRWLMLALGSGGTAGLASLAGCGGGSGDAPPPPPSPPPPPTPPPSGSLYQSPNSYSVGIKDGLTVTVSLGRVIPIRVRYPLNFLPAAGERLPVVIWSHGGGAKADGQLNNAEWGDALAGAGYVVIHMAHIPRTSTERDALYAEFGLTPTQGAACFGVLQVDRPRDATAVINALATIQAQVPELPAPLDLDRVAMGGHSFGSYTVRTIEGARVDLCPPSSGVTNLPANWPYRSVSFRSAVPKAFMALSPQGPDRFGFFPTSWSGLDRPDITMSGDGDITTGNASQDDDGETPPDRIYAFTNMPPGEKWLMYIASTDAVHNTFNLNNNQRPDFVSWVRATGLAFMDTYLRGSTTARSWLATNQLNGPSAGVARVEGR